MTTLVPDVYWSQLKRNEAQDMTSETLKAIDIVFVWYKLEGSDEPLTEHIFNNRLSDGDIYKHIAALHPEQQVYIDEVVR